MNLILQAIKSLFRKLGADVSRAQSTADTAKSTADTAKSTADTAKSIADDARYQAQAANNTASNKMEATNPVGYGSFSMGRDPQSVVGRNSHAEGVLTEASGNYSHAEGGYTIAQCLLQHVQGEFNVRDTEGSSSTLGKYAHIVGNGASDTARSNAHTLDWNGVPWYQGRPQFGGTAQDDGAQTVVANGDTEIILKSSTADSTKQFKVTVDDTGALTATEVTE